MGPEYQGGGIQNRINIADDGKVIFRGKALFRKGCAILVRGEFDIGDRFSSNRDCSFSCNDRIVIGNDCMLGWNIHVRDSDNHPIYYDDVRTEDSKPVIIGDHVWICSEAHVLKGTVIPDNCVVGYKAVVSKKFEEKNALIVGFPAQVKRTNIRWEH